ncbi:metallophosphoesterase [Desertihabitans aurantiacus]|uniref:metallophosphoesterase n=1 Tax=Desertihabitans aurantiacus TaxID=2282477 RepID=UPI0018E4EB03|nr:metallophosphoesterase [Desertihabitans aurantiacus]
MPTARRRRHVPLLLLTVTLTTGILVTPAAVAETTARTPATPPVEWREGFDSVELGPRVNDPGIAEGELGFTHDGPRGWTVENGADLAEGGVEEWRGWSFTTRDFWVDAEDQMRHRFARSLDVIAVADSDEYDDADSRPHTFDTTLVSPEVRVHRQRELVLGFDSHYRAWPGQSATLTVEYDRSGEQIELLDIADVAAEHGDGRVLNGHEDVRIQVPEGAGRAVFRWRFTADRNSWYWAIDNVHLRKAQAAVTAEDAAASLWVVSDIQGHPGDLSHGITDLHALRPDAGALLMVGDQVNSGAQWEWDEIYDVLDERADLLPEQRIAAIGNHERYAAGGWPVLRDRFLAFAQRDQVWGEYVVEGEGDVEVPVLVLGQDAAGPTDVPISQEQLDWFRGRLEHWTRQQRQVLVLTHFPLGDTVSASWIPWYSEHHQRNDELTALLGEHPNAVVLSGHTHYPVELGDWAVQRRTEGGHPDGFWAVNTAAMHVEWDARGENTQGITEVVTRDINRGLTVDAYRDRLVIRAHDFGVPGADGTNEVNEQLREVEIPSPFPRRSGLLPR